MLLPKLNLSKDQLESVILFYKVIHWRTNSYILETIIKDKECHENILWELEKSWMTDMYDHVKISTKENHVLCKPGKNSKYDCWSSYYD